jgi:ADP-heptose:LPS heptosyltransferase
LLRNIGVETERPPEADRDLCLTEAEQAKISAMLDGWPGSKSYIAFSVGGKVPIKEWGDQNWRLVLTKLSAQIPSLGVVCVGSADERERNDSLLSFWQGPGMNTCGQLTPRETAALIARADAFLGHDTGTMHLAAAVDTPVVAIFSARVEPGIWFTDRPRDRFFFNHVACTGCRHLELADCPNNRICMDHDPDAVAAAVPMVMRAPAT